MRPARAIAGLGPCPCVARAVRAIVRTLSILNPPAELERLPIEDQIDFVQRRWETIERTPSRVPVPEWHGAILRERLAAHRANPDEGLPRAEVRQRAEERARSGR